MDVCVRVCVWGLWVCVCEQSAETELSRLDEFNLQSSRRKAMPTFTCVSFSMTAEWQRWQRAVLLTAVCWYALMHVIPLVCVARVFPSVWLLAAAVAAPGRVNRCCQGFYVSLNVWMCVNKAANTTHLGTLVSWYRVISCFSEDSATHTDAVSDEIETVLVRSELLLLLSLSLLLLRLLLLCCRCCCRCYPH
jgi:hypothetical protein